MPLQGKINLNLGGAQYYSQFMPFIDFMKQASILVITNNGSDYRTDNPPGAALSAWDGYVDSDGNILNPSPANTTGWARTFYSLGSDTDMNEGYIDLAGTEMVCTFDGSGTVTITGENNTVTRVGNRLTWTWGNVTSTRRVTVTSMTASDPVRNLKLFKASNEDLLNAGEIFDPRFLRDVRLSSGMIRTMDLQAINGNSCARSYSDLPLESYFSWVRPTSNPGVKGGIPLSVIAKLANRVQSHPWACVPMQLGTLRSAVATAIAKGATTVVTAPSHNFQIGDECIPYNIVGMTQLNNNKYNVIAATSTTFTLDVDSTAFGTFTTAGANFNMFTSPLSLADITTEVTSFAELFLNNIASFLTPVFEWGNETWNPTLGITRAWLVAQATANTPTGITSGSGYQLAGYIAAHVMKTVRDVYGTENRSKWKGALGSWTANIAATDGAFIGINAYITNIEPTLEISDLFDYLALTGYWGSGGVFTSANLSIIQDLCAESESRFNSSLEATKYDYFNRIINEEYIDGRHYGSAQTLALVAAQWATHNANGLQLVMYEHGNHGNLGTSLQADATIMEFWPRAQHTTEDAANYTQSFADWVSFGGIWPSKFNSHQPITRAGGWGSVRFDGDSNPVIDAVITANKGGDVLRQRVRVTGT